LGRSLDVSPLQQGNTAPAEANAIPIKLDVHVDRVYSDPDRWLAKVRFVGERDATRWERVDLTAETTDRAKRHAHANLRLHTLSGGRQTLEATIDDMGAFLDDLGITANIHGGRLEVRG